MAAAHGTAAAINDRRGRTRIRDSSNGEGNTWVELRIIRNGLPRHGLQRGVVRNAKLDQKSFHSAEKVGMVVVARLEQFDCLGIAVGTPSFMEFKYNVSLGRSASHEGDFVILRHGKVGF
jgi:hypothetical protein